IKRSTRIISYVIIFSVVFYLGWALGGYFNSSNQVAGTGNIFSNLSRAQNVPEGVDLNTFWKVREILKDKYVDVEKLSDEEMVYGAIKGLTESLDDPYT